MRNISGTIAIGSDHGGFSMKEFVKKILVKERIKLRDFGTYTDDSCDYPLVGKRVIRALIDRKVERAILICKTGIGFSILANKYPGIRAALCFNVKSARLSRQHNDANVLILGANFIKQKDIQKIIKVWLNTEFLGSRHRRRLRQITKIEKGLLK